jgi:hypothetical protein
MTDLHTYHHSALDRLTELENFYEGAIPLSQLYAALDRPAPEMTPLEQAERRVAGCRESLRSYVKRIRAEKRPEHRRQLADKVRTGWVFYATATKERRMYRQFEKTLTEIEKTKHALREMRDATINLLRVA